MQHHAISLTAYLDRHCAAARLAMTRFVRGATPIAVRFMPPQPRCHCEAHRAAAISLWGPGLKRREVSDCDPAYKSLTYYGSTCDGFVHYNYRTHSAGAHDCRGALRLAMTGV